MRKILVLMLMLYSWNPGYSQVSDCQVVMPRISGTYTGECKNGQAHGKGIAQGIDRYEGEFRNGLPDGRGAYRWADGTFYEGYWKKGLREGAGKMISPDSTLTGYWKADRYIGKEDTKPYNVLRSLYVARSTFTKTSSTPNQVRVRLTIGGAPNTTVQDFSMVYSSGEEYRMSNSFGIQNVTYPVTVLVTYLTWNIFRSVQTNVTFEFVINEPGNWDVNIQN